MFQHLQAGPILFAPLVDGHDFASQRRQLSQLFLDILQPFMPLSVRHLVQGAIALLPAVLLILLVNLRDFRSQAHDLVLKNSEMIHRFRIYQQPEKLPEDADGKQ